MKLWVGLGNPGARYAGNRHNIGFMAVDRIAADHGFAPWRARFHGLVAEGRLGEQKVVLLKPETFMNLSGQSVRAAMDFLKCALADVTVFHDEIDLAPGKLRLKHGGGHAGHNGLRSISAHLGDGYARVRLGVGHPGHKDAVPGYVLHDFAKADRDWLALLLQGLADGAPALAAGDAARFQNAVALRTAPPRSGGAERREPRPAGANPAAGASAPAERERAPQQPAPSGPSPSGPASSGPAPSGPAPSESAPSEPARQEPPPAGADPSGSAAPDTRSALKRLADRFRG